ncbi:apolipoprotein(a)-like isoform X2 [Myxocyprinus asiaticus]|uniref:apolipoprotein(a)-like isoform X2 n=1 Tax=Myxocyprinus asiaticus TaxID=70543 RepID=UPI0022222890|nr:apolipoprotein(a)-like isoform X2 [Myxocyprinus asiaticus]
MKVKKAALLVCLFFFTGFQRGQNESTDVLKEYVKTEGAWIVKKPSKLYTVNTAEECATKCIKETSFTCRSFTYIDKDQDCITLPASSKTDKLWERAGASLYEKKVYLLECVNGIGTDYRGTKSTTKSGRKCQSWKAVSPHLPNITPKTHPKADLESNFCRNPNENKGGPWCYTTDPEKRWEHCDIQKCTEDCMHCNGENYRGKISFTQDGYMCQRWDSQSPHGHGYSPSAHPEMYLEENYCRYSEGEPKPWCYTTTPNKRWDYCSIPRCTTEPPTIVPELTCATGRGSSYRGTISVTESGKTCQNWASQYPHEHVSTAEIYPCKGLEGNYCRNPDNEKSPWCYTTDPETRWEYCTVPSCRDQPGPEEPFIPEGKECYEGDGSSYRGEISETVSGKQCQFWTSSEPHVPFFTPEVFPEADLRRNLCRNPDGEQAPWCYTTDPSVRWEYCNIRMCDGKPGISKPQLPTDQLQDAERGVLDAYVKTDGVIIVKRTSKLYQVKSVEECASRCNKETSFPCRSFTFSDYFMNCVTSPVNSKNEKVMKAKNAVLYEKKVYLLECVNGIGTDYRGTKATTKSGRTCQRWKGNYPHLPKITAMTHPKADLESNFCRNPNRNKRGPWCYTTDPDKRTDQCNIQKCTDDCMHCNGENYRGKVFTTENGYMCQRWDSQSPHNHNYSPSDHSDKYLEENYCRNPSGEPKPWCFTTSPSKRWDYCSIPQCTTEPTIIVPELTCATGNGSSYRGTISVTESGKTCQNWASQTSHKNSRTPENYPCKGLEQNYCRNPDNKKWPWCFTTDPETRWEYCNVPSCGDQLTPYEPFITEDKECYEGDGSSYHGAISETISGRQCQFWASREPHVPFYTPEDFPESDLRRNLCRNPDGEQAPWCYTTDPSVRWEYCNIKRCDGKPRIPTTLFPTDSSQDAERDVLKAYVKTEDACIVKSTIRQYSVKSAEECAARCNKETSFTCRSFTYNERDRNCVTLPTNSKTDKVTQKLSNVLYEKKVYLLECVNGTGTEYRGTKSTTKSGRTCQQWEGTFPHLPNITPKTYPEADLESNFCRNPNGDNGGPWCYTTDQEKRWEHCDITNCTEECMQCNGELYRGKLFTTANGYVCQRWDSQSPHSHDYSPSDRPELYLEENYCRSSEGEFMPWCYTTSPNIRWDYCLIPLCTPTIIPELTCVTGRGSTYSGTISVTESGKTCQHWASQTPHMHNKIPVNYPCTIFEGNYCRNPDNSRSPWCYTTDPDTRWEYCNVPSCGDQPKPEEPVIPEGKECYKGDGSSYRGAISETVSGKQCQFWTSSEPHVPFYTPEDFPGADLRRNLCRNPDGDLAPWCYTTDPSVRWEYCKIEKCNSKPSIFTDCKVGNGADYRGPISTTILGVTCQKWSSMTPHQHASFTPETHPDKGLESNQCRNPDNDENGPWCYTTDPNQEWDYCQIPDCEGLKCGEPAIKPKSCFGRIVGGCISKPHSWPWQISFRPSTSKQHFCGGTLIDPQWVLTAAHCIKGENHDWSQSPSAIKIFLGIHAKRAIGPSKQERDVSKIIMGPDGADIALLKLDRPAVINDKVSIACLPEKDYIVPRGTECHVTGWGNTQGTGGEGYLKEIIIPVIENKVCNLQSNLDGRVKDYEMCAGIIDGETGSCEGDSGGPLVCYAQNRYVLQGVTSWGIGCATAMKPGVYTRVSKFVNWIEQSMKQN